MNIIVPSIAETTLTGFILAAEKTNRKTTWRIEFWQNQTPKITRNGAVVEAPKCPPSIIKFALSARNFCESLIVETGERHDQTSQDPL